MSEPGSTLATIGIAITTILSLILIARLAYIAVRSMFTP